MSIHRQFIHNEIVKFGDDLKSLSLYIVFVLKLYEFCFGNIFVV